MKKEMKVGSKQWNQTITGSKIAAICGMSKFSSAIDIFCLMTGREGSEFKGSNKPATWGKRKERAIVESFCEDYGIKFSNGKRNRSFEHSSKPFAVTPDYFDISHPVDNFDIAGYEDRVLYIEVKGLDVARRYLYGEEMSGEIDKEYYFQVQFGMGVVNAYLKNIETKLKVDRVFFRVLFGAYDDLDFVVERNDNFIKKIFTIGEDFLKNYVEKDTPPSPDASESYRRFMIREFDFPNKQDKPMISSEDVVKKLSKDDRKKLLDALTNYNEATDVLEESESRLRLYKNRIINAIGENYGMVTEIGKFLNYPLSGKISSSRVLKALIEMYDVQQEEIDRLEEESRGEPTRAFRYYPSKEIKIQKELKEV